jgi:hypothetical protein
MSKGLKYVFFAFCWSIAIVVLSSCRMPDMFSVSPYHGSTEMERDNGLDHNEWGLGLSFTWDLNPERYSNPQAVPHPGYLILNPDGTYWPKELLDQMKPSSKPSDGGAFLFPLSGKYIGSPSEIPEDTERVKEALGSLGLHEEIRDETE